MFVFFPSTACTCCAADSHQMALQLLLLTWRQLEKLSSEQHIYKEIQPGLCTHLWSFTLPSSLIISICHTSLKVLLHRTTKVHLPERYFLLLLVTSRCWAELQDLVFRSRPQRVLELASASSQWADTDTGKLGRISRKHLTSFYPGSQTCRS